MSSTLPIRIVSSAARAIADASDWWIENRPNAPEAFITDLENALKLIASHPDIGAHATNVSLEGIRRVHMARVHYHLYYRLTPEKTIDVLALWHSSRGEEPKALSLLLPP